ncbi:MAG TPA: hypothetical protein VF736_09110 [Pyrinomonadaceae bacterium]|jgi:hypothetical protein
MDASRPVFKRLDHVVARAEDPRRLFSLLTETLGLPVAWPLAPYPAFDSGGVALGNLYVEVMRCGPARGPGRASRPARLSAVVFEAPGIERAAEELSRRRIPHTPPVPYMERGEDGARTRIWSNVVLGRMFGRDLLVDATILMSRLPGAASMSDAGAGRRLDRWQLDLLMRRSLVFLCEYHYENFGRRPFWSEFGSHDAKRAADRERLSACGGGALGVESAAEVSAGVRDFGAARELWRRLYAPAAETAEGLWESDGAPALRLVRAAADSIQTLFLKVSSLARAETFLRESGMLGASTENEIQIAPARLEGLDVRLVARERRRGSHRRRGP